MRQNRQQDLQRQVRAGAGEAQGCSQVGAVEREGQEADDALGRQEENLSWPLNQQVLQIQYLNDQCYEIIGW